jgi:hypothetical protein
VLCRVCETEEKVTAMAEKRCDICGARFGDDASLDRHREREHAIIEREPGMSEQLDGKHSGKLVCAVCRADFDEAADLLEHMRVAHPDGRRNRAVG